MKYKTGQLCPRSGHYAFAGHIEGRGRPNCHPTSDERDTPMYEGDHFPPVKSCQEGAYWTYVRSL